MAAEYAQLNDSWQTMGWNLFNKPPTKQDMINYTQHRQRHPDAPYGYHGPTGSELVEHPADGDHPCPLFHAKPHGGMKFTVFPYDPAKP